MTDDNLWGPIAAEPLLETPAAVLRSQCRALHEVTAGRLDGQVVQVSKGQHFVYELRITAPALQNLPVTVVTITHDQALYPVTVTNPFTGWHSEAHDPMALRASLREDFQSDQVRRIVRGLLAQVAEADHPHPPA
jgi:hypothetical protein